MIHPDDTNHVINKLQNALVYGEAPQVRYRIRRSDKRWEGAETSFRLMPTRRMNAVTKLIPLEEVGHKRPAPPESSSSTRLGGGNDDLAGHSFPRTLDMAPPPPWKD